MQEAHEVFSGIYCVFCMIVRRQRLLFSVPFVARVLSLRMQYWFIYLFFHVP